MSKSALLIFWVFLCMTAPARAHANASTKLIPLPIYATLPNEGSTYGFMPVFLTVEDSTQHTNSIIAPSVSWNKIIRFTHTFRVYYYPSDDQSLTFIPSISSHVNRNITLEYSDLPRKTGALTYDGALHIRRSIFYRFFGLGPQSKTADESSYTRGGGDTGGRIGYNLSSQFNIGARAILDRGIVERINVDFLPLTNDKFPGTPGLGNATSLFEGMSLRFDTRDDREYSTRGTAAELLAGYAEGLSGTDGYSRIQFEAKQLWEEASWANGAARVFWGYAGGSNIPFFNQNSLGGSFRLRGFTEDRFIDKGAWEVELEQRLTVFNWHVYGVDSDWRIDPFVAVGQVYSDTRDLFRYARVSGGLGFRAFVHPNVLGRVDTAVGGDGLKIYVELGYPF